MRTEQSATRGSDVHMMEPLLGQACFSDSATNNTRTTIDLPSEHHLTQSRTTPSSSLLQNGFADLQGVPYTCSSTRELSNASTAAVTAASNKSISSLTSLDIAALRKCLTHKPKVRRVCPICGRECPSRHKLQRHLSTHSERRPYNCEICGKAFKWTEYLSKHMRTQHNQGNSNGRKNVYVRHIINSTSSSISNDSTTSPNSPTNHSSSPAANESRAVTNDIQESGHTMDTFSDGPGINSGGNQSQSQTPPDVFSPLQGSLITDQSSTGLLQDQLTPPFLGSYFSNTIPYPGCYGYPGPMGTMMLPGQCSSMCHSHFNNFSFYSNYQNYMPPQQPAGNMTHALLPDVPTTCMYTPPLTCSEVRTSTTDYLSTHSTASVSNNYLSSSSVSCQTQEHQTIETTAPKLPRQPVEIIHLSTKKDIGIQCEVGDETLQALFEEEQQALSSVEPVIGSADIEANSESSFDDGSSCVCKYPCEYEGCQRAYVHRKDLVRHMKVTHGALPKVLQPRIVEAPVKPYECQIGDCNKSYYHLKDLRRHQRQCHSMDGSTSSMDGNNNQLDTSFNNANSLRYPCDFNGCAKSYIHKKDLIRHKRMFHHDNSSHPSIPDPVIVIHVKKGLPGSGFEEDSTVPLQTATSAEPLSDAQFPMEEVAEEGGNMASLNVTEMIDNFSTAIATILDIDDITAASMFPTSVSQAIDPSPCIVTPGPPLISNQDERGALSPCTLSMTLLSQNI